MTVPWIGEDNSREAEGGRLLGLCGCPPAGCRVCRLVVFGTDAFRDSAAFGFPVLRAGMTAPSASLPSSVHRGSRLRLHGALRLAVVTAVSRLSWCLRLDMERTARLAMGPSRLREFDAICAWVGNPSPAGSGAPATTSIPTLVVLSGRWPDVVAVRQVDLHLGASHLLCATKAAVEVTQLPIVRRAGAVGTGCRGDGQDLTERGRALLTVSWRPSQSEASSWPMALPARASSASSTKPNPRERPVSRSVITAAEAMVP